MTDTTTPGTNLVPTVLIRTICAHRDEALKLMGEAAVRLIQGYALSADAVGAARAAHHGAGVYLSDDSVRKHLDTLIGGTWDTERALAAFRTDTDVGIWNYLIDSCGLSDMMDKEAKDKLRQSFQGDVPEATYENIESTLRSLFGDADLIFARGLANAFSKLDRRFKSHDGFKLGSRMILDRCFDENGWGWNHYARHDDTLTDVERVFAVLDGNKPDFRGMKKAIDDSRTGSYGPRQSECETDYFRIKGFKNGNAHLWFTRDDLVEKANKMLADYYGEVIGDAYTDDKKPEDIKTGTALTKDLQFFHTPEAVIERLIDSLHITAESAVLEPSAGEGHIVARLLKTPASRIHAVEIHPDRCEKLARVMRSVAPAGGGLLLRRHNFLTLPPYPGYNFVVMNPPFSGTHWMDHVIHAFKFLKPGGTLRAVLPTSARVNDTIKHQKFRRWAEKNGKSYGSQWYDLPPESFAETGTRIQTTILTLHAR